MKIILITLIAAWSMASAAEPNYSAMRALEKYGHFTITDGASYFTFSKDGQFRSGPMGMSGRELSGTWTLADKSEFTVTAQVGWVNGLNHPDDYRRIVLRIHSVKKRAQPATVSFGAPTDLSDGYWYIDEFVKIPPPKNAKTKKSDN